MALKTLGKLWRRQSKTTNRHYWAFKAREPIAAGITLLIFRGDEQDDGSCGSVCVAVDDNDNQQRQQQAQQRHRREYSTDNPFANGRHRNAGGQHTSPLADGEPLAMAPPLSATAEELSGPDVPF